MEHSIQVQHVVLEVKAEFESFTHHLERMLGRFDPVALAGVETSPEEVRKRLEQAAGEEGLMLFNVQEHGKLLNIFGAPRKAKQYVLGNPLIAITMTRHDIRAALYAPLRALVYEAEDHSTRVEFDQPSSLFGQFDNAEVTQVGKALDLKMANVIRKAEAASQEAGVTHKAAK